MIKVSCEVLNVLYFLGEKILNTIHVIFDKILTEKFYTRIINIFKLAY